MTNWFFCCDAIRNANFVLAAILLLGSGCFVALRAQELDKPVQNIDEDITAFAFSSDGRIAYAVNRPFKTNNTISSTTTSGSRTRMASAAAFSSARNSSAGGRHLRIASIRSAGHRMATCFSQNFSPLRSMKPAKPSIPQ